MAATQYIVRWSFKAHTILQTSRRPACFKQLLSSPSNYSSMTRLRLYRGQFSPISAAYRIKLIMISQPAADQFDWKKELEALRSRQTQQPVKEASTPSIQASVLADLLQRQKMRNTPSEPTKPIAAPQKKSELVKVSTIAVGSFGSVYCIYEPQLGLWLAQKSIPKATVRQHSHHVFNEIKIQAWASHESIIPLFHFFSDDHFVHLIMELAVGDNLATRLTKQKPSTTQIKGIAQQLISALAYLHLHKVVHRDIKPENVLVLDDHYQKIKLCDFGFAYHNGQPTGNECIGTLDYMAPEMVAGEPYDEKIDVWAVGAIIYEMLTEKSLLAGLENAAKYYQLNKLRDEDIDYSSIPDPQARSLLKRCLCRSPSSRSSCNELLLHSWFIN